MRSRTIYNDDGSVLAEYINGELVRGTALTNKQEKTHPGIHIFKSGYFEHIAADPIYCGSKADLRAVCRENNCTSDYAE
jgi:hypothetical protein